MSFTLRDLVDLDELDLTVLAGEYELHQPITWVHVSEAADPTPFLEGGELLLTTGLLLDEAELNGQSYLRRLADVGAVGLGFGTGLRYEHVPESLVMTARKVGLALVKVPLHTPFMAISKAVSRAIAAEEYAAVKRAYDAQQALTRAAIGAEGTGALIAQLARRLGAWAVLLDPGGTIVHAAPSSASGRVEGFDAELDRLRGRRAPASAAFRHGEHDVVVQSLGNEPRIRGFLAVGRADPLSPQDRHVVNTAVSLLTLGLEQSRRLENAERQLRTAVLRLLLVAQVATAQLLAQELGGGLPEEPIRVTAVAGPARLRAAAAEMLSAEAAGKDEPVFHSDTEDVLVIVSTDGHPLGRWLQQLPGRLDGLQPACPNRPPSIGSRTVTGRPRGPLRRACAEVPRSPGSVISAARAYAGSSTPLVPRSTPRRCSGRCCATTRPGAATWSPRCGYGWNTMASGTRPRRDCGSIGIPCGCACTRWRNCSSAASTHPAPAPSCGSHCRPTSMTEPGFRLLKNESSAIHYGQSPLLHSPMNQFGWTIQRSR